MKKFEEPLFQKPKNKYLLHRPNDPVYDQIWEMYNKAKRSFWVDDEIDLSSDIIDWEKLSIEEQVYFLINLSFLIASDVIINENISDEDFIEKVEVIIVKVFYRFQLAVEDIHSQTYTKILVTLLKNDQKKLDFYLDGINNFSSIKNKTDWMVKYKKNGSFQQRLIANAISEGIFFSSSFCSFFWLKKRGLMHGTTYANELISADEGLHRDFGCLLFRSFLIEKPSVIEVCNMVKEAVDIEIEFVNESLKTDLLGMNKVLMAEYVKFIADHLLISMGLEKYYNVKNPFEWMNLISLQTLSNFFERKSLYSKAQKTTDEPLKRLDNF
jgi:ribonucleoside-diphosphate reductase beta chain